MSKKIYNSFYISLLLFSIILLCNTLYNFCSIPSFRHDSLKYIDTYYYHFCAEGRWINYFLFENLKTLNIAFISCINIICFIIFSYNCLINFLTKKYSILLSITSSFIPSIYLLNEWGATIFPSYVLLALASLSYKKLNKFHFFIIFGALFNGSISHFYFLLPLLFISKDIDKKIIIYWIIGFINGYIVAQIITFAITGHLIKLAEWRNPHYINSFNVLIDNIKRAYLYVRRDFLFLGKENLFLCIVSILLYIYNSIKHEKCRKIFLYTLCLFIFVLFSSYAQSIPVGIYVSTRTTLSFFMGFLLILCFSFRYNRYLLLILSIVFMSKMYTYTINNIIFVKTISETYCNGFKEIKFNSNTLNGVIMLSDDDDFRKLEKKLITNNKLHNYSTEGFGNAFRWAPSAFENGFRNIIYTSNLENYNISKLNFKETYLYDFDIVNNYLILRINKKIISE